jgi:hypothetical protein
MMLRSLACSICMACIAAPLLAAEPVISETRIAHDMAVLSSDDFGGRAPGTEGEVKSVDYIQRGFIDAGLKPGAPGRRWLQSLPMAARTPVTAHVVARVGDKTLDLADDVVLLGRDEKEAINAPLAYAGYALATAKPGRDRSARGALVLYREEDQPGRPFPQPTFDFTRTDALLAAGAKAALAIVNDKIFEERRAQRNTMSLQADFPFALRGFIRESAAQRLIAAAGADLAALDSLATSPDFQPIAIQGRVTANASTEVRKFESHNVIGILMGHKSPTQAIAYLAHWDAFGECRPKEVEKICRGAVDNGSGTAGLLELARAFTTGPTPDRSILFIATTSEERGLLGSRAFAQAPSIPLKDIVAAFNLDTITVYPRGHAVGFIGAGFSTADSIIVEEATAQKRTVDAGEGAHRLLKHNDAWPMLIAGVPAFHLSGTVAWTGPDNGARFLKRYGPLSHTPQDKITPDLEIGGAAEDLQLMYRVGLRLSASDVRVEFLPGVPFKRPGR